MGLVFALLLALPARAQMPAGHVPLTLAEAVFLGLRDNRAIRGEYLQRIADRFALRVAERIFVPRLDVQAGGSRSRVQGNTISQGSFGPVVTWDAPTGARFQFAWLNTQDNPRGGQLQASSQLSFQVIQPLLAGGGAGIGLGFPLGGASRGFGADGLLGDPAEMAFGQQDVGAVLQPQVPAPLADAHERRRHRLQFLMASERRKHFSRCVGRAGADDAPAAGGRLFSLPAAAARAA